MRVYFHSTPEAAAAALANGFADVDLSIGGLTFSGVWLSERPQPGAQLTAEMFYE